jgi:nucleotide-binding universal stress UspA family protein
MKIVVGTDFNDLATAALRFASNLALDTGSELIVVYADRFEPPAEFTRAQVRDLADSIERAKKRTRDELDAYAAKHIASGVAWKTMVADDLPAAAIARVAQEESADFVVVGTHGRGGLQRLLLGSVAEEVIRESPVPVMTVRSTAHVPVAPVTPVPVAAR